MSQKNVDTLYHSLYTEYYNLQDESFISDLNIYEVFRILDFTETTIGKQYLYHTICTPKTKIEEIEKIEETLSYLHHNKILESSFYKTCLKIEDINTHFLPELIYSNKLTPPKYFKWAWILLSIEVALILGCYFYLPILFVLLPLLFINTFIHLINKNRLYLFKNTYRPVNKLLNASIKIKGSDKQNKFYTTKVEDSIKSLLPLRTKLTLLSVADYFSTSELFMIPFVLIEILKVTTLFEVLLTKSLLGSINENKSQIGILYEMIGKIDVGFSILKLRNSTEKWCRPTFTKESKSASLINIYHPLIENSIPNSIELNNKSVIIAGSNMSGKTTFLRTVGINNILAQTLNTCFAKEFKISLLKTITSLHNFDNILEGESFYFAEAKNLLQVLDSNIQTGYLIIIDELFKGTNSIERTAISKGTLDYLHKTCGIVFASTHDLELAKLLYSNYDPYHFNENINGDEILFDYKIKKGKLYIFNAINTLVKIGFPDLLMQDVKETFFQLEEKYKRSNNHEILNLSLK